jgi:hypothetical protein
METAATCRVDASAFSGEADVAKDDLTVSILQARIIERELPIKLVIGSH